MSASDYFEKYDIKAEELYDLEKFTEAIEFLEPAFEEFPEQYFFIAWRVLVCYRNMGQFDKCLQTVNGGVKRGYFFNLQWKSWDPIRKIDGAEPILAENERLKAEAEKDTKVRYEVHLPDGYTPENRYPLFLAMHCDSGFFGNVAEHRRRWKPDAMLRRGFIVVYLQSSQLLSSAGSEWEGDFQQARKDILQCYGEVVAGYRVDTEKVIASGFSGGASASIDISLKDIFPVKGFIALCPDKPEDFSKELCENARQRGTRGVIMEGELSEGESAMREMAAVFKQVGFPHKLIINEGIGHWYPDDLAEKLDTAIAFILNDQ